MEYTEEQKRSIQEQFATRRTRQLIAVVPVLLAIVLFAGVEESTGVSFGLPALAWAPVAGVAIFGALVFGFSNWRCPGCNKYLGKGFGPRFCPRCGVRLRG